MTEPDVHRSYSQLNTYRRCGEQYRLEKIEHAPQRPSAAAVAGSVIHVATEVMDNLIMAESDVDIPDRAMVAAHEELRSQLDYWNQQGYTREQFKVYGRQNVDWYQDVGIPNAVEAYWRWRHDSPFTLVTLPGHGPAIEVPFNIQFGNDVQVHGHIDRVFEAEDQWFPIDLKSGRKPPTDEQLGLYAMALLATYGIEINWGFYLYNLKAGEAKLTPPLRLSHWTVEKLASMYFQLDTAVRADLFIPHPGEECFHCPVINSCRFAQAVV